METFMFIASSCRTKSCMQNQENGKIEQSQLDFQPCNFTDHSSNKLTLIKPFVSSCNWENGGHKRVMSKQRCVFITQNRNINMQTMMVRSLFFNPFNIFLISSKKFVIILMLALGITTRKQKYILTYEKQIQRLRILLHETVEGEKKKGCSQLNGNQII